MLNSSSETLPETTLETLLAAYETAKERLTRISSIIGFPLIDWDKARLEARDIYLEAAVNIADHLLKEDEHGS